MYRAKKEYDFDNGQLTYNAKPLSTDDNKVALYYKSDGRKFRLSGHGVPNATPKKADLVIHVLISHSILPLLNNAIKQQRTTFRDISRLFHTHSNSVFLHNT